MATNKGFQILQYVRDYEQTVPRPSLREIQQALGNRTRQATAKSLNVLIRGGFLVRTGRGRYGLTKRGAEALAIYAARDRTDYAAGLCSPEERPNLTENE